MVSIVTDALPGPVQRWMRWQRPARWQMSLTHWRPVDTGSWPLPAVLGRCLLPHWRDVESGTLHFVATRRPAVIVTWIATPNRFTRWDQYPVDYTTLFDKTRPVQTTTPHCLIRPVLPTWYDRTRSGTFSTFLVRRYAGPEQVPDEIWYLLFRWNAFFRHFKIFFKLNKEKNVLVRKDSLSYHSF